MEKEDIAELWLFFWYGYFVDMSSEVDFLVVTFSLFCSSVLQLECMSEWLNAIAIWCKF